MVGKREGKERKGKGNIFRKLSFPNVKSCVYAYLEQFCISHQCARRGLLNNCCVPSTVLYVCQVLNGVLYHMIMTGMAATLAFTGTLKRKRCLKSEERGFWKLAGEAFSLLGILLLQIWYFLSYLRTSVVLLKQC